MAVVHTARCFGNDAQHGGVALLGIDLRETLAMQFKECKLLAMGN
jgi:hypothetical protein